MSRGNKLLVFVIYCLLLQKTYLSSISSNIGKDYFRINDIYSSNKLASIEFKEREKFYNKILNKWKLSSYFNIKTDEATYDIWVELKKALDKDNGFNVNWSYFISSCDFTPFKEKIGEHIYKYIEKNPEANNGILINLLILSYQILYYRHADPTRITQFYEKYYFKSQNYNREVYQFTKPKNVKKYLQSIIPNFSFIKSSTLFFSEEDLILSEELGIDTILPRQVNSLFDFVVNELTKQNNEFKSKSKEERKMNEREYDLNIKVNEEILKYASNKHDFKVVLSYLLKSIHTLPFEFYRKRFQEDEKRAYDQFYENFGTYGEFCFYIGPVVDLMKPNLNINIKDLNENLTWEVEFTSFTKVNLYPNQEQRKGEILKFSYAIPLTNERLLLEFHPEYIYNQLINPLKLFRTSSSINANHEGNKFESSIISMKIKKTDFSLNQYKFCMMINCGEGGTVSKFLKDSTTDNTELTHLLNIKPKEINLELYNLLRIFELDEYISTTPVDTKLFIDKVTQGGDISEPEDTLAYMRYLETLLNNDTSSKHDYFTIISNYYKASSLQKGMEGYTNSLSEKIFSEINGKQLIYLHGLAKKFILYNQISLTIDKLNKKIMKDMDLAKTKILGRR